MADPDAPAWMLDDDTPTFDSTDEVTEEAAVDSTTAAETPAEPPKPPGEWRKTYKKDVSYYVLLMGLIFKIFFFLLVD